ncbi:organic solvent tolerance protein OstA [Leptolyngbya sp. PCC 7375]|nr:organic solvent tolerance protein OstA [Leptolyngbya sp. PCC 7375]
MALIDLPPEPSQNQLSTVSISTVSPKTKHNSGAQHLLTHHHPTPGQSTDGLLEPSFSPRSLIPVGQLSEPNADDFSKPNLAQLPSLPPQTELAPAANDEAAVDTVNEAVDLEDTEAVDLEDAEAVDLENTEAIDLEDPNPNALEEQEIEGVADDIVPQPAAAEGSDEGSDDEGNETETPEAAEPPSTTAPTEALDPSKLEITADTQIFDSDRQVVIARGNVVFKLNDAFLLADEMWINLVNRYVLAEGNVILTRGEQEVRGERAEYSLLQEAGTIFETRGELFLPELEDDFAAPTERPVTSRTVFDPLNPDEDVTAVRRVGGFELSSRLQGSNPGSLPDAEGGIRRIRFEAARVTFDAEAWVAEEVRLTNDPFSPPELEFRTDRLTLVTLSPTADLLTTENPRLVFDQGFSLPLLKSRYILNRGEREQNQINPFLISIGSDSEDRGGVFLESEVPIVENESTSFSITPQYFLERATNQGLANSDVFGVEADFDTRLSPSSNLSARVRLTNLDLREAEDNLRGSIRNRYLIGDHLLSAEYSYRDRLFNGSLGFQNVRSSLGAVLLSPPINLDKRGLILTYQAGAQLVTSRTDRTDLLGRPRGGEDLITLGRMQASARLRKGFNLWRGTPLPATPTEGLRYTPVPVVPFLNLNVNLLGVASYYTSGDFQEELSADVRLDGQIGHLSKNFFDYTRFNLGYSQDILSSDNSPFLFDRNVDRRVVSFGVLQQIFGPILLGFQTSININSGETVNTDFIFEYTRRTYGLVFRYSPTRETGSIGFRLSDFNWLGSGSPFDEPNIRQVDSGVVEER